MKKLYLILILGCSLMLSSGAAVAESCHSISCADLGYSTSWDTLVDKLAIGTTKGYNLACKTYITCPIASQWDSPKPIACVTYRTFTSGSCPSGAKCIMRYKITGCQSGYKLDSTGTACVEIMYDVVLSEVGASKLQVVKAVRSITGLGQKEAKELVDNAPSIIKSSVTKTEVEEIKQTL